MVEQHSTKGICCELSAHKLAQTKHLVSHVFEGSLSEKVRKLIYVYTYSPVILTFRMNEVQVMLSYIIHSSAGLGAYLLSCL